MISQYVFAQTLFHDPEIGGLARVRIFEATMKKICHSNICVCYM